MSFSQQLIRSITNSLKKSLFDNLSNDLSKKFDLDQSKVQDYLDKYLDQKVLEKKPRKKSSYTIFQTEKRKEFEKRLKEKGELEGLNNKEKMEKVSSYVSARWNSVKKKPEVYAEYIKKSEQTKRDAESENITIKKFDGTYEIEHKGSRNTLTPSKLKLFLPDMKVKELKQWVKEYQLPILLNGKKSDILSRCLDYLEGQHQLEPENDEINETQTTIPDFEDKLTEQDAMDMAFEDDIEEKQYENNNHLSKKTEPKEKKQAMFNKLNAVEKKKLNKKNKLSKDQKQELENILFDEYEMKEEYKDTILKEMEKYTLKHMDLFENNKEEFQISIVNNCIEPFLNEKFTNDDNENEYDDDNENESDNEYDDMKGKQEFTNEDLGVFDDEEEGTMSGFEEMNEDDW